MKRVLYPDPILRKIAADVEIIDDKLRAICAKMFKLTYELDGLGMAAPQVGLSQPSFFFRFLGLLPGKKTLNIIRPILA